MMFAHALRLERLKQRHVLLSAAAILSSVLIVTILRQLAAHEVIREGLAGMFFFIAVAGIPFAAAFLGGSAGAALRTPSTQWIEESLPFHPRTTFLSAYLISFLHTLFIILPVLTGLTLLGEIRGIDTLLDFRWSTVVLPILIIHLHALSFTNSYITKRAITGDAAALILCGLQLSLFSIPLQGFWPYWLSDRILRTACYLTAAISPLLYFVFVSTQVQILQRNGRLSRKRILSIIALVLSGPIALAIYSAHRAHLFENALSPLWTMSDFYPVGKPLKTGGLFSTASGTAVRITSHGNKIVLEKNIGYSFGNVIAADRAVWVLTSEGNNRYTIRYEQDEQLKVYSTFISSNITPRAIVVQGNSIYLFGTSSGQGQHYAEMTNPQVPPIWQKNNWETHYLERSFDPLIKQGKVAYLSSDRKQLIRRLSDTTTQNWPLPGTVAEDMLELRSRFYAPAYTTRDGPGFLLAVKDSQSKQRLILCHPDGTISEPWPTVRFDSSTKVYVRNIPGDGTAVFSYPVDFLYVIDSDGSPFVPVRVPSVSQDTFVQFRRRMNDQLWIVATGKRFLKMDLKKGSHSLLAQLPEDSLLSMATAEEGIYLTQERKILLLDWDGKTRVVSSAMLE